MQLAAPPLQLSPVTADLAEAREWFEVLPRDHGRRGPGGQGCCDPLRGGRRDWLKVKHRDTVDVNVGGVLGPIDRLEVAIAGRYSGDEFMMVGSTVPLTAAQSAELRALLRPAGTDHPWPDEITSYRWGGKDSAKPLTKARPMVVVEVLADAAMQAGRWRHGLRYVRPRADLQAEDVPALQPGLALLTLPDWRLRRHRLQQLGAVVLHVVHRLGDRIHVQAGRRRHQSAERLGVGDPRIQPGVPVLRRDGHRWRHHQHGRTGRTQSADPHRAVA